MSVKVCVEAFARDVQLARHFVSDQAGGRASRAGPSRQVPQSARLDVAGARALGQAGAAPAAHLGSGPRHGAPPAAPGPPPAEPARGRGGARGRELRHAVAERRLLRAAALAVVRKPGGEHPRRRGVHARRGGRRVVLLRAERRGDGAAGASAQRAPALAAADWAQRDGQRERERARGGEE